MEAVTRALCDREKASRFSMVADVWNSMTKGSAFLPKCTIKNWQAGPRFGHRVLMAAGSTVVPKLSGEEVTLLMVEINHLLGFGECRAWALWVFPSGRRL